MAKKDEVVLVSPKGAEYTVTNPETLYNLLARGYKPKGQQSLAAVEQKVAPTSSEKPSPTVATDAKPASK